MVHVKKCPLGKRGSPSREFIKGGRWQVYCYGWIDRKTDEPLPECQKCLDFVGGDKFLDDYEEATGGEGTAMDKLHIAHTALGKLIEDIEHYKKLKAFYNDWAAKHPHAHVWEEPDDEIRERLEEYQSYYPYQFKQQLLVIERLIKEVASKMQGESYE